MRAWSGKSSRSNQSAKSYLRIYDTFASGLFRGVKGGLGCNAGPDYVRRMGLREGIKSREERDREKECL